jgi:hypothetical protein
MIFHVPFVAYQELTGEKLSDDARALWRRVNEVGSDHGRVAIVPAAHRSVAAHGLIGIEEAAAGFFCDALLDGHDLWNGRHGGDGGAAALATVHRTHDEDGGVG